MLIVVKTGGKVLRESLSKLTRKIKNDLSKNRFVLVHGGGVEVTEIASKMGKKQEFVVSPKGFRSRYTDRETVEIYAMVMMGRINKRIITALQSQGICGVGLSGMDGLLVRAKRKKRIVIVDDRGRKRVVDGGYTGKICEVNPKLLWLLIENGCVPVIAPIAISEEFEPLNVNGDRMAAHIAGALKADRLVLLTDVSGIRLNGKLLSRITISELRKMLPKVGYGMMTKAYAAIEALNLGVGEVVISSGLEKKPVLSSVAHECGTVICHG